MASNRLLIFDLDGTVNDSSPGVIHCFQKTAEKFGKDVPLEEIIEHGLTGPFEPNIKRILGLTDDQVKPAIDEYVKFYISEGQWDSQLFPGIEETFNDLRSRGYLIGLATLMAQEFAETTLEKRGIINLFDSINGASLDTYVSKEELIERCLIETDVAPEDACMIGDSADDKRAADLCGVRFIGVTYGYGLDLKYCIENGIEYVNSPIELLDIL